VGPDGVTETIHSPEFTADKAGCTHIKEIAVAVVLIGAGVATTVLIRRRHYAVD